MSRSRSGWLVALVAVAAFLLLGVLVATGASDPLDVAIIRALRDPATADLLSPLRAITELGSTGAVSVVAIIVLALGAAFGRWRDGLGGALAIVLASIGNSLLKVAVARARPDLLDPIITEHGYSFPSGHSALSMVAYGVLAVVVARLALPLAARVLLIGVAVLIIGLVGLSRVWLGVHYPTDVLAGWSAGLAVVAIYAQLSRSVSPGPGAEGAGAGREGPRSGPPAAA